MNCPVCREPFVVVERDGIELDVCPWCRGLWFDAGELALLAETMGRALTVGDDVDLETTPVSETRRQCPRCDKAMEKVSMGTSPRIPLDRCRAHGLWFDHGELGLLIGQMGTMAGSHAEAALKFMGETIGGGGMKTPRNEAGIPEGEV